MATIPTIATQTAGATAAAAWANSVQSAYGFLLTPLRLLIRQTSVQSITNGTWTSVTFDTEIVDNDNAHSTSTNTSRFTAATAGWWTCSGAVAYSVRSDLTRVGARWAVNGTVLPASGIMAPGVLTGSGGSVAAVTQDIQLNAGDYLELQGFQTNTAAVAVNTFSSGELMSVVSARFSST